MKRPWRVEYRRPPNEWHRIGPYATEGRAREWAEALAESPGITPGCVSRVIDLTTGEVVAHYGGDA